jgi:hypothetical protein
MYSDLMCFEVRAFLFATATQALLVPSLYCLVLIHTLLGPSLLLAR